jgi:diguanylate cyclase (GGDEF)-like protein
MSARPPLCVAPDRPADSLLDASCRDADLSAAGAGSAAGSTVLEDEGQAVIRRLAADPQALARLVEEHRIFKEAIEKSPVAYCVYDAEDRLIAHNAAYARLHPALHAVSRDHAGKKLLHYADLVREQLRGELPPDELEQAVAERVQAQRQADGKLLLRHYGDLGYFRLTKYPLSGGAVAGLAFDVNELKQREAELTQARAHAEQSTLQAQQSLELERQRKREARLLSELGEWLQSCKTLKELFQVIGRYMAQIFSGTSGELYIYSNSRDVLDGVCAWNRPQQLVDHFQPDECWALRRGRMYKHGAGLVNFPCGHAHDVDPADLDAAYLCLPIIAHGDTVGLLHIRFDGLKAQPGASCMDEDTSAFAVQCSEQISLAIANVKLRDELRDQSTRDPLTGLFNRRFFFDSCRQALHQANRNGDPVSVISLDADHFKRFNDTHGHDAGDTVLRSLSDLLGSMFQGRDVVARLGGEEFSVLLPGCTTEQAALRANEIRQRVEELRIRYRDLILPRMTISAGVASAPQSGQTTQELLRAADEALYVAKNAGRNQIHVAAVTGSAKAAATDAPGRG